MTTPIVNTKLFVPHPPPNLVSRPRLLSRLESGITGKLTLISAQAGFGKTTLLSEWISQYDRPVCWLSLDEQDNDPHRFLKYVIAALQKVNRHFGEKTLLALQSSKPLETEVLLSDLINKITAAGKPFIFILDDFHVITEPEIQQMLLFLLDHMPPEMHLIISGRSDPPWPLSRLKVRGEIQEIRSEEMRFTLEEAAAFLNDMMGLVLSSDDIAALEKRTEGWIVGLQLAALSMQQRQNKAAFIQSFTGSHRYVVDYLVEEVLDQQPPEIREFLLKTSILTRLTGSLCDSLLDRQNSQMVLNDLEQKNLFLFPLDDERRWYRYHYLFADLLRQQLQQNLADEVQDLHIKASVWYEENGLFADAIHHALISNEVERVVQLTDGMAVHRLDYGELKALLLWLGRLPESIIALYPWLLVARTWAFFNIGKYEEVQANLGEIERVLSTHALPAKLAIRIRGHAAAIRSYLSELQEDPRSTMQQAEDALALLPDQDIQLRALVATRLANCLVWFGDLNRAIIAYQEAGESSKRVGEDHLAITALSEMAVTQMINGKLRQAVRSVIEINNYAENLAKRDGRRLPAMGILYRHMSSIAREQNELTKAGYYSREAIKLCKQWGEKESYLFALMALARVQFARGEYEQVDQTFRHIVQIAGEISPVYVTQLRSSIVQYQLLMGKLDEAENWVQEVGLTTGQTFGYDRQQDYYNYARYLYLKGNYTLALDVIDALLKVVTVVGAGMFTIKYKTLQAILLRKLDKANEAMVAMQAALSLARADGYVRSIIDEGEVISDLLHIAIARGIEVKYAEKLLAALRPESKVSLSQMSDAAEPADQLSLRERQVLRLLVTDLSAPEIADELIISASTVRSHIKSIYSKLDVHSRYEAVRKAKELNLQ